MNTKHYTFSFLIHEIIAKEMKSWSQNKPEHPTLPTVTILMSHNPRIPFSTKRSSAAWARCVRMFFCCDTRTTACWHIPVHLQDNAAESSPCDTEDALQATWVLPSKKNLQTKRNKGQGELTEKKSHPGIEGNKRQHKMKSNSNPELEWRMKEVTELELAVSQIPQISPELWHWTHLDNAQFAGERVFPITSLSLHTQLSRQVHIWSTALLAHCLFRESKVSSAATTSHTLDEPTGTCCSHLALITRLWSKIIIYFSRKCQLQKFIKMFTNSKQIFWLKAMEIYI